MAADSETTVTYGCSVVLRPASFFAEAETILSASGFVNNDLFCVEPAARAGSLSNDHIFRIVPKLESHGCAAWQCILADR